MHRVVPIIDSSIYDELIRPFDDCAPESTLWTLRSVKMIVDSTFISLPKEPRLRTHYNPKSPTKTLWKIHIACDLTHRIINVSRQLEALNPISTSFSTPAFWSSRTRTRAAIGDRRYGVVIPSHAHRKRSRELGRTRG